MSLSVKVEDRQSYVIENEGKKIFCVLHRPLREQAVPAVLMCHGLAGTKVGKQRMFVRLATQLAEAGIASFRFDFRGHGDSEGELQDVTLEGEVSDALKALDFLTRQPGIDTSRMGILGRSLGGAIAIMAASRTRCIKRVALWSPLFDAEDWHKKWQSSGREAVEQFRVEGQKLGLPFFQGLFSMDLNDPLNKLSHIPILHIHSEDDVMIPIDNAGRYLQKREGVEYVRLKRSGHDYVDPEEQKIALQKTVEWFQHVT